MENSNREEKRKTLLDFLVVSGAMGSKKAIDELKRIFGDEPENIEYI